MQTNPRKILEVAISKLIDFDHYHISKNTTRVNYFLDKGWEKFSREVIGTHHKRYSVRICLTAAFTSSSLFTILMLLMVVFIFDCFIGNGWKSTYSHLFKVDQTGDHDALYKVWYKLAAGFYVSNIC
jgi:hypothetical protein